MLIYSYKYDYNCRFIVYKSTILVAGTVCKRQARWDWIVSKKPEDPAPGEVIQPHVYWLKGYGQDKAKDDKLIEMNSFKTLNYHAFRAIIRSVANECIVDTPGSIKVGSISRRHWNNLKEPSVNDLKSRVVKKKEKN